MWIYRIVTPCGWVREGMTLTRSNISMKIVPNPPNSCIAVGHIRLGRRGPYCRYNIEFTDKIYVDSWYPIHFKEIGCCSCKLFNADKLRNTEWVSGQEE